AIVLRIEERTRGLAVSSVRSGPVPFGLDVPVALVSGPGAPSVFTVGTADARTLRADSSSMTLSFFAAGAGLVGSFAFLKRSCSATLTRITVGELKKAFR